jgi:hypothetical protein
MNALGPIIAGLSFVGGFYLVNRIRLRRALNSDIYQHETAARIAAAPWRRHLSVVIDADGSYIYTAPRPEQKKGGGSDGQRVEEAGRHQQRLGVVSSRSLAGGKGSSSGSPCKYCDLAEGHTGQCWTVSYTITGGTTA